MSQKSKVITFIVVASFLVVGLLFATGVVSATSSDNPFTVSSYIASGELYVSISPVNVNLVTGNYQVLVTSQGAINVYNASFPGTVGASFSIVAQYPTLLVEIMKGGVIVQQQTIQGVLSQATSNNSPGFTILDAGIVELQFVLTFVIGMIIFERRQQNKEKLPDEYFPSMDAGNMLVTKELFRNPAKTKEQGEDRLRLYLWLKDNGYEIDAILKKPAKKGREINGDNK